MSEPPPIARPNYFDGEALLTADFVAEQRYHMEMLSALNRGLHISGIASGLDVYWQQAVQSRQVRVSAGMAIDRLGREIILTAPKIVVLSDAEAGSLYYLTIGYDEAYADLTDETGVPGYKRIVQQPKLAYTRSLPDPGLNILLAVVGLSSDNVINALTYRVGAYERRYVAGRFGGLELVIPGSGIGAWIQSDVPLGTMTVSAQLEAAGAYLAFDAGLSRFDGALSVTGNLGIGIEHPDGNLQVSSPVVAGAGTCTSNGTTLFLSNAISPALRPGDTISPRYALGTTPPAPTWGVIAAATEDATRYRLEQAFSRDLTMPHSYTYLRGIVAQFSAPVGDPRSTPRDLLRIERNGTVSLGMPAMPDSGAGAGAAALSITRDRRVGVGLLGAPLTTARLEVNGDIQASGLSVAGQILARGTVKAQSFEGNGSKLQNLPILSYWTKVDPTSDYSPIYYASGAVCVQTTQPFGSLTVGTGRAFVGSGLVTASATKPDTVIGNQTRFLDQVNPGDSIVVGTLRQIRQTVSQIVSDTELLLTTQFPVLLQHTPYTIAATGKTGSGLISSNGTRIIGTATAFTKDFKLGDVMQVDDFLPHKGEANSGDLPQGDPADGAIGWMVAKVVSQTELTLIPPPGSSSFPANLSAYMVRPSLMAYVQDSNKVSDAQPLNAPALLVVSNAIHPEKKDVPPNTVAINYELGAIDPAYALMVSGPTNFTGGGHFDKLSVEDLSVTDKAIVGGTLDPKSPYRLQVSGGDLRVDQSVSVGAAVSAQTLTTTGNVSAGGSLSGSALTAAGVNVFSDGTVGLFGTVSGGPLSTTPVAFTATTDGFVVCQIQASADKVFGWVSCSAGGRTISATAVTTAISSDKGTTTFPQGNTMTMPVRKGEVVSVQLFDNKDFNAPTGYYHWITLGPPHPGDALGDEPPPEALHQGLDVAANQPRLIAELDPARVASAVGRLTDALHTISGKAAPEDVTRTMTETVLGLTCVARPDGAPPSQGSIDAVVETGMRILGAAPTDEQKAKLAQGIAGLVEARYPTARAGVEQFIDDVQQVLGTTLDDADRRRFRLGLLRMLGVDDDPAQR